jgi:predicted 3-demethylubiquinone-9 3-methyltransferase (glyoxalase superfamily)
MQKITPRLWFDKQAREAADFYVSLFPGSTIASVTTLSGTPSCDCNRVSFEFAGLPFMATSEGTHVRGQGVRQSRRSDQILRIGV